MRRTALILALLCLLPMAAFAESSEAPDTRPLTTAQLERRSAIYDSLRIAGGLTTVGLVALIAGLLYREHRRKIPPQEGAA